MTEGYSGWRNDHGPQCGMECSIVVWGKMPLLLESAAHFILWTSDLLWPTSPNRSPRYTFILWGIIEMPSRLTQYVWMKRCAGHGKVPCVMQSFFILISVLVGRTVYSREQMQKRSSSWTSEQFLHYSLQPITEGSELCMSSGKTISRLSGLWPTLSLHSRHRGTLGNGSTFCQWRDMK